MAKHTRKFFQQMLQGFEHVFDYSGDTKHSRVKFHKPNL